MATAKKTKTKPQDAENQTVLAKAQSADIPTVVKEMGDLQVLVQSSLSNLSAALTSKVQHFSELDKAVSLTEQRIAELHAIEGEVLSLESVKALRATEQEEAVKAKADREAQWAEEDKARAKQWKREFEEHAYTTKMQNQRALDEFNAEVERQKRVELVRQEELLREWSDRENKIKSQEQDVQALRDQAATFEARVKNEVSRAEAIVKNSLERDHKHTLALLAKETETTVRLHQGEVDSFKATIDALRNQVADLTNQLLAARADTKEVATQALQSASGRQTNDALMRVVGDTNNKSK